MKIDISLHFSVKCKESENVATEELIQRISSMLSEYCEPDRRLNLCRVTQVVGQ